MYSWCSNLAVTFKNNENNNATRAGLTMWGPVQKKVMFENIHDVL